MKNLKNNWKYLGEKIGPLLILTGLLISIYIVLYSRTDPIIGLGLVGLLLSHLHSLDHIYLQIIGTLEAVNLGRLTISILTFFLATLAFANQIEIAQNTVLGQVFNNFWTIISTIVAFYFAARVVENNNLSNNSSK